MEADIEGLGDRYERAAVPGELLPTATSEMSTSNSSPMRRWRGLKRRCREPGYRTVTGQLPVLARAICGASPDCPGTSTEPVWSVRFRSLWADLVAQDRSCQSGSSTRAYSTMIAEAASVRCTDMFASTWAVVRASFLPQFSYRARPALFVSTGDTGRRAEQGAPRYAMSLPR
jgi:hypothetical protein